MIRKVLIPGAVILVSVFFAVTLMATAPKLEPDVPSAIPTTVRIQEVVPEAIKLSVIGNFIPSVSYNFKFN